jgi:hypothetical protein
LTETPLTTVVFAYHLMGRGARGRYFREARPDAVSFPQYFKNAGYLALGAGKL